MKEKIEITVLLFVTDQTLQFILIPTTIKFEVSGANKLRPAKTRDEKEQNLSLTRFWCLVFVFVSVQIS